MPAEQAEQGVWRVTYESVAKVCSHAGAYAAVFGVVGTEGGEEQMDEEGWPQQPLGEP